MTFRTERVQYIQGSDVCLRRGRHNWHSLGTASDLSKTSIQYGLGGYKAMFKDNPIGVIYSPRYWDNVNIAELSREFPDLKFLAVEDFDDDGWAMYGPGGVIYSEGA